jgi:hypothetical protein
MIDEGAVDEEALSVAERQRDTKHGPGVVSLESFV